MTEFPDALLQAVPWGKLFKAAKVMIQAVGVGKRLIEGYGKLNAARKAHERIVDLKKQRATLQNAREVFERERWIAQQSADAAKHTRSLTQNTVSNARKNIKRERQRERCETEPPIGERLDNSFVSGTQVLMADGSTKPIEQVQIGEQVLATDPVNGRTDPQIVDALITGEANKPLVELTVAGQSIFATADHPFWSVDVSRWTPAGGLAPGANLRTASGTDIHISAIVPVTRPGTLVYNLSVTSLRTYYVLAGNTPVLVHNTGPGCTTARFEVDARGVATDLRPLGRGNTGRITPNSLNEKLAMESAMSNPASGIQIRGVTMSDPRWMAQDGWVKMTQNINGVEVHYVRNTITGQVDDYKFK